MDTIKRFYKKARGKAKDPPRLPSHQSALTTPARSPRSTSQEPAATDGKVIYTNHSAMVFASQAAIAPTANATPTAVIPALETGPSPRLEDAAGSGATYSQPNVKPQGEGRQAVEAEELKKPEKAIATAVQRKRVPQEKMVTQNSNTTSVIGNGAVINNINTVHNLNVVQTADEQKKALEKITSALKERHVPQATYDAQLNSGCMKQTRVRILKETSAWIKDPDSLQICWITGLAGTGKTSIAKTVCEQASSDAEIILGGSFFCSRSTGLAAQRDIRCVIPTLTRLLALNSVDFRLALAETIDDGIQHKEVTAQIELLLRAPLSTVKDASVPILFVIDALDECGGETTDGMLDDATCHVVVTSMLEALVGLTRSEPKLSVKFLVTSRPEPQIRDTSISNDKLSQILRLHTVDVAEVSADIRRYITQNLDTKLSGKPNMRASITERDVEELVQLCDGLFIVAATAIAHTFGAGADAAVAKFKKLLNSSRSNLNNRAAAPLDRMYEFILNEAVKEDDPEATELPALRRLLASLLSARMALSVTALAEILDMKSYNVSASLSRLHAVVHVPEDEEMPGLRTVHASFGDFLYGRAPSHIRIHQSLGHDALAHGCLHAMAKQLRFNISRSASSYAPNPSTKPDSISLSLEYACMQWVYHVAALVDTGNIHVQIGVIFRPRLLHWLEVMSILRQVWRAARMLFFIAATVNTHAESDLAQFLRDAHSFVTSSYEAIETSAPHIYLSALPFADKKSLVHQDFAPRCTGLITVDTLGVGQHRGSTVIVLTGHDAAVSSLSYSSDGRLLVSGSKDGSVRVWDTRTGEEARSPLLSGTGSVLTVDFARNSKWVASGTVSGAVCVWDVAPGQTSHRQLGSNSGPVKSVKFSPDSLRLASALNDNTVRLWNPETGEQLAVLSGQAQVVNGVAFSPDDGVLAIVCGDQTIRLWHSTTGQYTLKRQEAAGYGNVEFSPDGEMIAATYSHAVRLSRWRTGERIVLLNLDTQRYCAHFSPDGRLLAAACGQAVRLWTLQPDPQHASWVDLSGHGDMVNWATFSPDDLYIASASDDATIRIWSARSGQSTVQPLSPHDSVVYSVAVSHDGTFIVSGFGDKLVRMWNLRTGDVTFPPLCEHTRLVSSVSISPDGRLIASGMTITMAEAQARVEAQAQAVAQAVAQAEAQARVEAQAQAVAQAVAQARAQAWAEAEAQVQAQAEAQAQADHTIRLWDTQLGAVVGEPMHGHTSSVTAMIFSHDGRWLASASGDNTLRIWVVATQQALAVSPFRCQKKATSVALSPDNGLVAAGDVGGSIYLWRTDTGEQAHEPLHADEESVRSLAFSPDGMRIVSGGDGNAVRIWDINAGQCILVLQGHKNTVWSVAWCLNGSVICTGSEDATLRLWDPVTGASLATLRGHTRAVRSVAFTGDGKFIVSGSEDTTIRKWDVDLTCQLPLKRSNDPVAALASATLKDGWLVGSSGELILWVPAEYHKYLPAALYTVLIDRSCVAIGVGDGGLHAGLNWSSCWRG